MVVCMSRRICVELYREIAALRPSGITRTTTQGALKVVMTGSASDPLEWQGHIRNKPRREALAQRFRDPEDPFTDRDCTRHVADRLRRAESPHHVRGQADARARADAGHRPGQPRLQGQARRPGGGLPGWPTSSSRRWRPTRRAAAPAEPPSIRPRPSPSCWRSTRSAAGSSMASTGHAGPRAPRRTGLPSCPRRRNTSWPRRTARRDCCGR